MTSSVKMILGITYFSEGSHQQGERFKISRLYHVDPDVHLSVRIFYVVSGGQSFLWWARRGRAKFWQDFSAKFVTKTGILESSTDNIEISNLRWVVIKRTSRPNWTKSSVQLPCRPGRFTSCSNKSFRGNRSQRAPWVKNCVDIEYIIL